jgi:hypothetical protein
MAYKYRYRPKKKWNNRLVISVAALVIVSALALYMMFYNMPEEQPATTTTTVQTTTTTLQVSIETGRLLVAVKDVQYGLPGGNIVLNVSMKIGNITAHYVPEDGSNESEWVQVSNDVKIVELLDYTDTIAIIGENELDPGKYTQIRMYVTEANVTIKNTLFGIYTGKVYQMIIPSNELKTSRQFSIDADRTTVVTIDFDVPNSITRTADGYLFKPVVTLSDQTIGYNEQPSNSEIIS